MKLTAHVIKTAPLSEAEEDEANDMRQAERGGHAVLVLLVLFFLSSARCWWR